MKLYPIHTLGIQAYCSDLIVDPADSETVFFMSVAGYQATVKRHHSQPFGQLRHQPRGRRNKHYLTRASFGYKAQLKKLPSGLVHGVLFRSSRFPRATMTAKTPSHRDGQKDELLTLFFPAPR